MFNQKDLSRNNFMLEGKYQKQGYDWWWHSFTGYHHKTGEPRQFFIEFFGCNPGISRDKVILGQSTEAKKNNLMPSYVMVKVGTWGKDKCQLHQFYSWNQVEINNSPFEIKVEDCFLNEFKTKGHVNVTPLQSQNKASMSDHGNMSWDLKINKQIAFNVGYGASKIFRKLKLFEMFWHAQGMKTQYDGEVIFNGQKYLVGQNCFGYADKNWGKDFTSPWIWLSSNNLKSTIMNKQLENSVFNIGGGRPKIGQVALNKKLLGAFYYEGKEFEFNFSKFWTGSKTTFNCEETDDKIIWNVCQKTWNYKMETLITCQKSDMLLINYEAPNGKKLHNRLYNGGNGKGIIKLYYKNQLIDCIEASNVGCEYGEYDKEQK